MLACGALYDPVLALALVVGTSHGNVGPYGPCYGRMVDLRLVLVTKYLEPLLAGEADSNACPVDAVVVGALLHLLALPGCPGPGHVVLAVKRPAVNLRRLGLGLVLDPLPRHTLVLSEVPREAPLQLDAVDGSCYRRTVTAAVEQPGLVAGVPVWATDVLRVVGKLGGRVYGLPPVPVQQDAEPLAARTAQGDGGGVLPLGQRLHLHRVRPGIPGADDGEAVPRVRPRCAFVLYAGVLGAPQAQRMKGVNLRGREVTDHAAAPEVSPGIRATDPEGGHPGDARAYVRVLRLDDKERRVARELDVRVDALEVQVRGADASGQHQDALRNAANASTRFHVPKVRLGARDHHGVVPVLHDLPQRADLDGIAKRRSRAMALRNRDVVRAEPRLTHGVPDASRLRRSVGSRHAGAPPVLVDVAPDPTCAHELRILFAIANLHQCGAAALSTHEAIGPLVEGQGPAGDGQHLRRAVGEEGREPVHHARAHHQRPLDAGVRGHCAPAEGRVL
mmetsp:Transcript_141894/g.441135  ORF Transcript_141894/g.441135 Transcript_141894/m.441135 type:complete len:505 (+) Transcript_141894:604-2118(+)